MVDAQQAIAEISSSTSANANLTRMLGSVGPRESFWADLEAIAVNERIAPLLFKRLMDAQALELAPEIVASKLRQEYAATGYRNLLLSEELCRIKHAYADEGIDFMVLKGLALAHSLYHDLAARPIRDLDLLVRPYDFDRAQAALSRVGYKPDEAGLRGGYPGDVIVRAAHSRQDKIPLVVEVHGNVVEPPFLNADQFWSQPAKLSLLDEEFSVLGLEETLVQLCLHHSVQHWCRPLLTALDIVLATSGEAGQPDWSRFIGVARRTGLAWAIREALVDVESRMGVAAVPQRVLAALEGQACNVRRRVFRSLVDDNGKTEPGYATSLLVFGKPSLWCRVLGATVRPSRGGTAYGRHLLSKLVRSAKAGCSVLARVLGVKRPV